MPTTSRIVFECATETGTKTFSYNYVDPDASTQNVRALATALITNGSIFDPIPTAVKNAKLVTTETTEYNLNS